MSDTPETDAAQHEGLLKTNPIPLQVVTANFARKLERERDEIQEKYDTLAVENMLEVNKLCKERDEAIKDAARIADKLSGLELRTTDELAMLEQERDEAREEINNIRKTLSESGEAVGNGVHNYSIIEMIQNLIKSKSYFMQKSYAEFFKPTFDEEGAK